MKISVSADARGQFYSIVEIVEYCLPASQVAAMRKAGQIDSGKRQHLRSLQHEDYQDFLKTVNLDGQEGALMFMEKEEAYQAAQDLAKFESGHGRPMEMVAIDREVPCL